LKICGYSRGKHAAKFLKKVAAIVAVKVAAMVAAIVAANEKKFCREFAASFQFLL
jgi:tetrahydromethanopterin S-methyltransferase subunit D